MEDETKEEKDEELERMEKMLEGLERLAPAFGQQDPAQTEKTIETITKIQEVTPLLSQLMQPKEQFNHVGYSAKLALSKYQNHQISFGMRVPMNGDYYKAFADVMMKAFNFHEAILAFRHLNQHVIGLKSERQTLLVHITRDQDQYERHKADLLAILDQAPGKDADLLKQAEHQKDVLCRRESLDEEEQRIKDQLTDAADLWARIQKYTHQANELGEAIKAGKPENWTYLPEQFHIPLDEGHTRPDYYRQKSLAKQYDDFDEDYF